MKIVDNTVVSAFINEIRCLDILKICCKEYLFSTSKEVYDETTRGSVVGRINRVYDRIKVVNKTDDPKYREMIKYLMARYPYLHKGELSSFLVAILDYELNEKRYYYVTDDRRMKKKVNEIWSCPFSTERQIYGDHIPMLGGYG